MKVGKKAAKGKTMQEILSGGIETKMELFYHTLELARLLVQDILEENVRHYCGDRYSRQRPHGGRYVR